MPDLFDDLGFLLSRASGLVVRAANEALAAEGLRVRQYSVLALACESVDGSAQRELAAALGLDPSQVVLLVDELVAAGLLERRACPADRRTRLVTATQAGRGVHQRAARYAATAVREQLDGLSDDECALLRSLLRRALRHSARGAMRKGVSAAGSGTG